MSTETDSATPATLRDGAFLVIAKAGENKVLVQSPLAHQPDLLTREEFVAVWDGQLILMTRRAGLSDITRRFLSAAIALGNIRRGAFSE